MRKLLLIFCVQYLLCDFAHSNDKIKKFQALLLNFNKQKMFELKYSINV